MASADDFQAHEQQVEGGALKRSLREKTSSKEEKRAQLLWTPQTVWRSRQSREWRPRRASVAGLEQGSQCEMSKLSHGRHSIALMAAANYRALNDTSLMDFLSNSPSSTHAAQQADASAAQINGQEFTSDDRPSHWLTQKRLNRSVLDLRPQQQQQQQRASQGNSSSCSRQQQQHRRATCCHCHTSCLEPGSSRDEVGEQLHSQDKQRKFLIFSMALKQMMSLEAKKCCQCACCQPLHWRQAQQAVSSQTLVGLAAAKQQQPCETVPNATTERQPLAAKIQASCCQQQQSQNCAPQTVEHKKQPRADEGRLNNIVGESSGADLAPNKKSEVIRQRRVGLCTSRLEKSIKTRSGSEETSRLGKMTREQVCECSANNNQVAHNNQQDLSQELETLIIESWLDDHPDFAHDYFLRKASRQLVDDWLISHAKVSNTHLSSQLDLSLGLQLSACRSATLSSASGRLSEDLTTRGGGSPRPDHQRTVSACFRSARASSHSSGSATPVRKISATDFESRTGSGFLRPMISTTPDGRPTFLSQPIMAPSPSPPPSPPVSPSPIVAGGDTATEFEQIELLAEKKEDCEGEHEVRLIFELVKNICNDLDIRTLLHKILKNIAVLINADKSSLFLVCGNKGDPNRHLVSQLFNVGQDSDCNADHEAGQEPECITIPWGTGLVGYVAESGESLNIANCYEDPRFTDTVDQRTGYVTRHMLCAPIFDKRNEIVGVAQVINKRDGNPFSESDEIKFKRYLQFCGIGLRNAQSYENCQLENRRNQVLLDLARMVFEEQSTIEQVVYRIMLHTQSLLECQRCQVLLIDDGSDDLDQLLQQTTNCSASLNSAPRQTVQQRRIDQHQQQVAALSSVGETLPIPEAPKWSPQCASNFAANSEDLSEYQHLKEKQQTKLFSLVFDLEYNGNDFVMHSDKEQKFPNNREQNQAFPINIGITGYVAMTGETLNIEDAHQCDRFDKSVDENSNFRHKSILCMPIRNGQRQIIGVSQLINKKNGRPFNKNDEDLFEAFAIFCGLGIHNTLMYERVLKVMAKQRVTFEVLSYHATAPLEEAKKLHLEQVPSCFALNLSSLKFNDFSLDEQFMLKSCLRFFLDLDLMRRFQIDKLVFCNWILSVQKNYRKVTYHPIVGGSGLKASPVKYHNWRHAFNVSQMMFAILINTQICQALGELETLALLIACLCHDLDHRGTNNSFQIKSASPLAQLYSTSTMEHHHFDQCVMILNSQGNQILAKLSPEEYSRVIVLLEEAILATDLANYFQRRELFFQLVNSGQFDWKSNPEHRSLLRCMLMTACDIAAITKPWTVQKVVADLVMSEFYQQGDIEKHELNIEPIDLMNRDKMSKLPEMQIGFIDSICAPIYAAFAKQFPHELSPLLEGCLENRGIWVEMAKKNKEEHSKEAPLACYLNINNNNNNDSEPTENRQLPKNNNSSSDINLFKSADLAGQVNCSSTGATNPNSSPANSQVDGQDLSTSMKIVSTCANRKFHQVDCQRKSI